VVVEVKIIKTRQEDLEELGFDWILSPFGTAADVFLGGGTIGSGIPRTATDFISPVNFTSIPGVPSTSGVNVDQIITGGLRSGDSLTGDSIDSIINNPTRQTQSSSVAPGILALTGLFTDGHVQLVMRGLSQKKGTDVSAVPSVTTRSGQQASIEIIRELIYPTEYEPPEVPQGVGGGGFGGGGGGGFGGGGPANIPVTPSMPTAFDMRKVGVLLDVLPTASSDKRYVNISVKPELTDFEGFVNYGSPILAPVNTGGLAGALTSTEPQLLTPNEILMPVFSKMATETSVTVADGSTLVLGGLLEERRETISDSVPILGDIPFVGRLFRSEAEAPIKTAVVFLLKVRVVDAAGRPFHP
jgi:general secretion pathway protein D